MEYTTALGICNICGAEKLQVEGNVVCINCIGKASGNGSGLVVTQEDPGEEALNKLLVANKVVKVEKGQASAVNKPVSSTVHTEIVAKDAVQQTQFIPISNVNGIDQALSILRALPMPKDVKQFKQIAKAIKILESLGA